jgi:hypothetical protein
VVKQSAFAYTSYAAKMENDALILASHKSFIHPMEILLSVNEYLLSRFVVFIHYSILLTLAVGNRPAF